MICNSGTTMRLSILIAALAIAAPIGLCAGAASARVFEDQGFFTGRRYGPQAAWCSHENTGGENVTEECSFNSFEDCRRLAMGANNTFCTPNPAYDMSIKPVRRGKGNRERVRPQ
jgi:hypothetical protein